MRNVGGKNGEGKNAGPFDIPKNTEETFISRTVNPVISPESASNATKSLKSMENFVGPYLVVSFHNDTTSSKIPPVPQETTRKIRRNTYN